MKDDEQRPFYMFVEIEAQVFEAHGAQSELSSTASLCLQKSTSGFLQSENRSCWAKLDPHALNGQCDITRLGQV